MKLPIDHMEIEKNIKDKDPLHWLHQLGIHLDAAAQIMEDNNAVAFCGGCNDEAVILNSDTGEKIARQTTQVWLGGDPNFRTIGGVDYEESMMS